MLFIMATILMIQLQSFHRLFLVFAVAPLALIGVVMALLPSGAPLGFVAILGVLALDRHPGPQLGHIDRADRRVEAGRTAGVGRGGGGHRASHAADHAHCRGCQSSGSFRSRARFSGARWLTL